MISIATLKAAGLSADQIVSVLESAEADRGRSDEAKRVKNRDRMRASRAARAAHSMHNANTAHNDAQPEHTIEKQQELESGPPVAPESALSYLLPSSESQQEKKEEEKKERAKRTRAERGHVCPDDLHPSEVHFAAGARKSVSRPRVEACCEAMKSWSKSNSHRAVARKVDWNAALFGWIDRESEKAGKANGHANGNGKRTIMEACDALIDRVRAFDEPPPSGIFDVKGEASPRLLSKG